MAAAAAVALAAAGAATAAFTPATLAGSCTGSWRNTTFGSTGPVAMRIAAAGGKLTMSLDLGGGVFGCTDPAGKSTKPIGKGSGPNTWSARGFSIAGSSKALGTLAIAYDDARHALAGSGSNPPCRPGLAWKVAGTFNGAAFTGTVAIALPDGTKATSTLQLKRG